MTSLDQLVRRSIGSQLLSGASHLVALSQAVPKATAKLKATQYKKKKKKKKEEEEEEEANK